MTTNRRLLAEWELTDAVLLVYPHEGTDWFSGSAPGEAGRRQARVNLVGAQITVVQLANAILNHQDVLLLTPDGKMPKQLEVSLPRHRYRLRCVSVPTDDTWARDFGPISVEAHGQRRFLDFRFNGWGGKFDSSLDNQINQRLVDRGYLPADRTERHDDFVLEGGSIDTDGRGTLLTTTECLRSPTRNPQFPKRRDLERELRTRLGVERVLWLDYGYLDGDDTDSHIDILARFADPETILYSMVDPVSGPNTKLRQKQREKFEKMEAQLRTFRTPEGKPYRLVPLPVVDETAYVEGRDEPIQGSYANFLLVRGAVLMPTYSDPKDVEARRIFERVFPDREVRGVSCTTLLRQHGSLHCMTMGL